MDGRQPPAPTPDPAPAAVDQVLDPLIEKLPPQQQEVVRRAIAISYQGPLPPSFEMESYNRIIPGGGDRIMKQFERQTEHRTEMERMALKGQIGRASRGQWMAFILVLACLGAGILIAEHSPKLAGLLFTTTIAGILGAFVIGRLVPPPAAAAADDEEEDEDERAQQQQQSKPKPQLPSQRQQGKKSRR